MGTLDHGFAEETHNLQSLILSPFLKLFFLIAAAAGVIAAQPNVCSTTAAPSRASSAQSSLKYRRPPLRGPSSTYLAAPSDRRSGTTA